jgi:hypothetical protein
MANQLPTFLRRAGMLGAGAVTTVTAPTATAVVLGTGLTLVTILALTGALARHKTRREAAYRMLALLFKVLTTEQAATGDATGHPRRMRCTRCCRDAGMPGCRDAGMPGCRDAGMPDLKHSSSMPGERVVEQADSASRPPSLDRVGEVEPELVEVAV